MRKLQSWNYLRGGHISLNIKHIWNHVKPWQYQRNSTAGSQLDNDISKTKILGIFPCHQAALELRCKRFQSRSHITPERRSRSNKIPTTVPQRHFPPSHKNTATMPTLHQIRLATLTGSYRHLANSFMIVIEHNTQYVSWDKCWCGIPAATHLCLSMMAHVLLTVSCCWARKKIVTLEFIHTQPNRTL